MFLPHDKYRPIGFFDSGIGGLTVANAVVRYLPHENIIYFGDSAHMPYGDKSADAIRYYCLRIVKFLIQRGCKLIIIACNTASSVAYDVLVEFYQGDAQFINVVDPLVQAAAHDHSLKSIGVIATKATVQSGVYERKLLELRNDVQVKSLSTPLLAPMIEEGFANNSVSQAIIDSYLKDPKLENIDALLLACTHYPLIRKEIENFYQGKIKVFDSTDVVAHAVHKNLEQNNLLSDKRTQEHHFYVSDLTQNFEQTTKLFYKEKIHLEHLPIWS
jgi:glutamate racemase